MNMIDKGVTGRKSPGVTPLAVKRSVACQLLSCGMSKLDHLVATKQLEARKCGKTLLILMSSIVKYLDGLPPAELLDPYRHHQPPQKTARVRLNDR